MKRKLGIIVLTLIFAAGVIAINKGITQEQIVFINEVRSWDTAATRGGYFGSDYIELYNASEEEISLEGWYVSDDSADMKKCQIHGVSIAPKGFVLLYANEKNDTGDSLNFKLNPAGEKIYLSDAQGYLVDSVYVPEQEHGTVYARVTDGAKEWCVKEETTDYSNNEGKVLPTRALVEPKFSHESGFYEEAFELTIETDKGKTIYYTLDGSEPTEKSLRYETPIVIENISNQPNVLNSVRNVVKDWEEYFPDMTPVDKATIIRAVVIDENGNASEVATRTYFVNQNNYKQKNVVSVISDFDEMFGERGIFVTGSAYDTGESGTPIFKKSGRRWEIQGNMEIFQNGNIY